MPDPSLYDPMSMVGGNPDAQRAIQGFNALRDQYLQQIMAGLGQQQPPVVTPAMQQQGPPPSTDWRDDDLLGAAQFWGIPREAATSMPREQLVGVLNDLRTKARPSDEAVANLTDPGGALANMTGALSMFGVGAAQAATGLLRNLPIVGESLGRIGILHEANIYFKSLEEGVRASTSESIQPVLTGERWLGNLAALAFPGTVAWMAAGAAGKLVPYASRLSPIVRGASQGAASAWLLEGGSETAQEHPLATYGLAAGLGAILSEPVMEGAVALYRRFRPLSEAAANKVTAAFVPHGPGLPSQGQDLPPDIVFGLEQSRPASNAGYGRDVPEGFQPSVAAEGMALADAPLPAGFQQRPAPSYSEPIPAERFPEGYSATGERIPAPQNATAFYPRAQGWTAERGIEPSGLGGSRTVRRPAGFQTADAEMNASALNKVATVLDSPDLPQIVASPAITDVTAGQAATISNPGGTNITQGVADPAAFMSTVGENVRFAKAPGVERLDALTSDRTISGTMVKEYETHGVYTGQQVTTRGGVTGEILGFTGSRAVVKPQYSDTPFTVSVRSLSPAVKSPGTEVAPQLWEQFQHYATGRAMEYAGQLSGGRITPEQIGVVMKENMPQYMDDFFREAGILRKGDQARLRNYFDQRYVAGFKALAPAEVAATDAAVVASQAAHEPLPFESTIQTLDQHASTRGFLVVPKPGLQVELVDSIQSATDPASVLFDDAVAAHKWLETLDRDLPDLTPQLDVPAEVAGLQLNQAVQAPNLNAQVETALPEAIAELGAHGDPVEMGLARQAAEAAKQAFKDGRYAAAQQIWESAWVRLSSMRKLFANIDNGMRQMGIPEELSPFRTYVELNGAHNAKLNYEYPLMTEASNATMGIRAANKRSGLWSQIYLIEDDAQRLAAAQKAGLNDKEIAAFGQVKEFWHKLFGEAGLDAEREIRRYLPEIQKLQSSGKDFRKPDWMKLSPETETFFEYVRRGNVNSRELNPDTLLHTYIKALSWRNTMAEPYAAAVKQYQALADASPELAKPASIMMNWLDGLRYGYQPDSDVLLDWAHAAYQTVLGRGVTREQTRSLLGSGIGASYNSLMGFRIDVVARDTQQILLALPRAGKDLVQVMSRFMTGNTATRTAMMEQGLADGFMSAGHARSLAPGSEMGAAPVSFGTEAAVQQGLQPTMRQRAVASASDWLDDFTPAWMRSEKLKPTYLYGKQGETIRMLVGTAGKQKAAAALAEFRAAGPGGDFQKLLQDSRANTFDPAVQRTFQQYVSQGADDQAARFLGQELAHTSQFQYGQTNSPIATQTMTGRIAGQLGSYPLYYAEYLREALGNGTVTDKVKTLATIGGVSAAYVLASKQTGWNFNRLNPFAGLSSPIGGGPLLTEGLNLIRGASAETRELMGQEGPPGGSGAGTALGRMAGLMNPVAGLMRTAEGVAMTADTPNPAVAMLRLLTTGERGATQYETTQNLEAVYPQTQGWYQTQVQPMPSPMRAGQYGTPFAPQQPVVNPPDMSVQSPAASPEYERRAAELRRAGIPESVIPNILGAGPATRTASPSAGSTAPGGGAMQ